MVKIKNKYLPYVKEFKKNWITIQLTTIGNSNSFNRILSKMKRYKGIKIISKTKYSWNKSPFINSKSKDQMYLSKTKFTVSLPVHSIFGSLNFIEHKLFDLYTKNNWSNIEKVKMVKIIKSKKN